MVYFEANWNSYYRNCHHQYPTDKNGCIYPTAKDFRKLNPMETILHTVIYSVGWTMPSCMVPLKNRKWGYLILARLFLKYFTEKDSDNSQKGYYQPTARITSCSLWHPSFINLHVCRLIISCVFKRSNLVIAGYQGVKRIPSRRMSMRALYQF